MKVNSKLMVTNTMKKLMLKKRYKNMLRVFYFFKFPGDDSYLSDLCSYPARYAPSNSFMTAHLCHSYSEGSLFFFLKILFSIYKSNISF